MLAVGGGGVVPCVHFTAAVTESLQSPSETVSVTLKSPGVVQVNFAFGVVAASLGTTLHWFRKRRRSALESERTLGRAVVAEIPAEDVRLAELYRTLPLTATGAERRYFDPVEELLEPELVARPL